MTGKMKVLMALILFGFMISLTNIIYQPVGQLMSHWQLKKLASDEPVREVTLPYSEEISEPGIYEFRTIISPDNMASDVITIRRINGYAFELILNDQMIYSQGNMMMPTANLWNHSFLISIPPGLLESENNIVIRTYGLHDIGFIMEPTLGMGADAYLKVELQNLVSGGVSYMMAGANFFVGILLIGVGISQKKKKKYYIQFGIASIFGFIYSFEYLYRQYTGSITNYLWIRKILMISVLLSIGFLAKGLYNFVYKADIDKRIWYGFCLSLIGILIMPNYHTLNRAIKYYNIMNLIILISIIIGIFKSDNKKLFFSVSFTMSAVLHTIIIYLFRIPKLVFWYYGVGALFVGITYNLVVDFTQLQSDNKKLDIKASMDPLTGAYNRSFLESVSKVYTILVFMDVDKFKEYNDTLGHHQGDLLLQGLVESIKNTIKDNGIVIRYGGDEFVILLKNMTADMAKRKIKDIQDFMKKTYNGIGISYGINLITDDVNKVLQSTDEKMYDMKRRKC